MSFKEWLSAIRLIVLIYWSAFASYYMKSNKSWQVSMTYSDVAKASEDSTSTWDEEKRKRVHKVAGRESSIFSVIPLGVGYSCSYSRIFINEGLHEWLRQ